MENLIIATTPLQAKIANYIQNLYSEERFFKVYITPVMNERQEHYSRDFDLVLTNKLLMSVQKNTIKYFTLVSIIS